jgi:hypothetical protein
MNMSTVKKESLMAAADMGILHYGQVNPLFDFLNQYQAKRAAPRFNGTHVLYYLGGMLAIGAASLFTNLAVEAWGMGSLLGLCLVYFALAYVVACWLERQQLGLPAGIFATLAVALVPLIVYALQHVLGFWADGPWAEHYRDYHAYIDWRWLVMELATLLVGVLMLWRFSYTFLVMPIALTLFYMSMDIVPALLLANMAPDATDMAWELRQRISMLFGVLMLGLAFVIDLRSRYSKDYAFWLYVFGVLAFWGALSSLDSGTLSGKLIYAAINTALVFLGAMLGRRVFTICGGLGIAFVLGDLSWHYFRDSLGFLLVLTLLGFGLIAFGVWWSKNEIRIANWFRRFLPLAMQELLEVRRYS